VVRRETDIFIIGAGPYGLTLANFLASTGEDFVIAGRPMELWLNHTFTRSSLRSNVAASEIAAPGDPFAFANFHRDRHGPGPVPTGRVSVETYREYVHWMLKRLEYDIIEQYVTEIASHGSRYRIVLESGDEIVSRRVVVASGVAHHLNLPVVLADDPRLLHSYDVPAIEDLSDEMVLVIGAGQSAAEAIATLASNGNSVHWYSRKPPRYFEEPLNLPPWIFNIVVRSAAALRLLPGRLVQALFGIFSATTITPNHQPQLDGIFHCRKLPPLDDYDHIVAATGYRYSARFLTFLADDVRRELDTTDGMPNVDRNFQSSLPGLYFLGPITEHAFGPPMKFMIGARYAGPKLADVLRS